jgi:rhodanese-related sulfurtransferase
MAQVKNAKYEFLLNRMLSRSVPIITIPKAAAETDVLFLDAREPAEYSVSHISNAVCVGYDHFNADLLKTYPKNKKIVVYCSMGMRSEKIGEKLLKLGYTNVQNLYGGLFEWVNDGHSVVDIKAQPTNKVHAYGLIWGIWLDKGEKVY